MSAYAPHWLVRWTTGLGEPDEERCPSRDAALTRMTRLLLDGINPLAIHLYRSADWHFEITAHIKTAEPARGSSDRPTNPNESSDSGVSGK